MFLLECLLTILTSLIWAIFLALSQYLVQGLHLPVLAAGFLTRLVVVSFLILATLCYGEGKLLLKPGRKVPFAILIGVINVGMNISALAGLKYTSLSNASIITKLDVLFTLLVSRFIVGELMDARDWLGVGMMTSGIVVLLWHDIVNFSPSLVGDLLFIIFALTLTLNAYIIKYKLAEMSNRIIAVYNLFTSCLGFGALVILFGDTGSARLFFEDGTIFLGVMATGLSAAMLFLLYYRALSNLPFWVVRVMLLFVPVFGVLLDRIFLARALTMNSIIGMLAVISGAALIILHREAQNRRARNDN